MISHREIVQKVRQEGLNLNGNAVVPSLSLEMLSLPFESDYFNAVECDSQKDRPVVEALFRYFLKDNKISGQFMDRESRSDRSIIENQRFEYRIWRNPTDSRNKDVVLLLHGLNEKSWDKYHVWAAALAKATGKSVLLFPMAFHMERAPQAWRDLRRMRILCEERKLLFPEVERMSFANVALSTRLHLCPERFLRSGMQTYHDILGLIRQIRSGGHPIFDRECTIDLFGYSIGAFLAEMLFFANFERWFDASRLFLFCGGSTLDQCHPVNEYILDSEASAVLQQYLTEISNSQDRGRFCQDSRFRDELGLLKEWLQIEDSGSRKKILESRGRNISAVGFEQDSVFPGEGFRKTFGNDGKTIIDFRIEEDGLPFRHENPFPITGNDKEGIDARFRRVLDAAVAHLAG